MKRMPGYSGILFAFMNPSEYLKDLFVFFGIVFVKKSLVDYIFLQEFIFKIL